MMQPWEWLLYVNTPILVINLLGMWVATTNGNPKMARLTYWINVFALVFTIEGILSHSFQALMATYGDGTG